MSIPQFLFVGTAKAGTTSIYHYLRGHPEVEIPMKETFYFMRDVLKDNHLPYPKQRPKSELILTDEAYQDLYRDIPENRITGEIGTGYLYYHEHSIPLIRKTLGPDVKIAIILRHPVDRCHSSYMHFAKDLFEDYSFEDALDKESERIEQHWDFMWRYKSVGMYAEQVRQYMDAFRHVKVWLYDDLKNDSLTTLNAIAEFIGISPFDMRETSRNYNPSGTPKYARLQKFITHENPLKATLRPLFRALLSQEKRERIRKGVKSRNLTRTEGPDQKAYKQLLDLYHDDIKKLSVVIDRDLDHWLRYPST